MRCNEKTCEKFVIGLGVVSSFGLIIGLSVGLTVNKDTPENQSPTSTQGLKVRCSNFSKISPFLEDFLRNIKI